LSDRFRGGGTAGASFLATIILLSNQAAVPSHQGGGRHQGTQFLKRAPTQLLGPHGQAPTLVVIKMQPLSSELFAEDDVLFLKIVDDILLVFVQPASEGNQQ